MVAETGHWSRGGSGTTQATGPLRFSFLIFAKMGVDEIARAHLGTGHREWPVSLQLIGSLINKLFFSIVADCKESAIWYSWVNLASLG